LLGSPKVVGNGLESQRNVRGADFNAYNSVPLKYQLLSTTKSKAVSCGVEQKNYGSVNK